MKPQHDTPRRYESAYRGYLIDHHSPAPPVVEFSKLNVEEYRTFFRSANLTTVMMYCKDHWGYSYYDTKIGTRHPGLDRDWVAEIAAMLREEHIEFNAYYCLEYDTLAPKQHPEWSIVDAAGRPVRLTGRMAKWGMACYETGYREYVLGQLREIVDNYRPDSLFLDIFGKSLCYCDQCRGLFRQTNGYDMPTPAGENTDEYAALDFGARGGDVNAFLEDGASRMLDDVLRTVKAIDPSLAATINFAALYPKVIRDKLDYQFTEPWAGNWLSAAYSRDTARGQSPQLGPGDVSEVYNYRPQAIYSLAAAQIAAAGCRVFFYSGSQHTDGTLDHEESRRIGEAYRTVAMLEPYLSNRELIGDVAIIQSDSSVRARAGHAVVANAIGRCKRPDFHREAVLGAMQSCDAANLCWTVLPEQDATPERLRQFGLVILAGLYHVPDELADAIRAFVQSGGSLIADGACGLYGFDGSNRSAFPLSDVLGCSYRSTLDDYAAAEWGGYVAPDRRDPTGSSKDCAAGGTPVGNGASPAGETPAVPLPTRFWADTPDTFIPAGRTQISVAVTTGESLGWLVPPAVALTETTWVNWWNPPPSADYTPDHPAIVTSRFGEGRSIYFAYDFFRGRASGVALSQGIFRAAADELLPNRSLRLDTDFPETVSIVAYAREDAIVVHVVSHLAEKANGEAPPVTPGVLRVNASRFRVRSAGLIAGPTETSSGRPGLESLTPEADLPVEQSATHYEIALPPVRVHYLVVVATGAT